MGTGDRGQDVIDTVPVMAYRARADLGAWQVTWVTGGLVERLGVAAADLRDTGDWVLRIHPGDRERVVTERCRAVRTGWLETEYRLRSTSGADLWVHDVAVRDRVTGEVLDGLVLDLTDHHRADETLADLTDARLAATNRAVHTSALRDTTLRLFVHDLRSPLSAVGGLARTLRERGERLEPAEKERIVDRMVGACVRVADMVDDFVGYWDMEGDTTTVDTHPVVLADLLPSVLDEVADTDGRVEIDVHDVVVSATPELLRRILVGLLRNALQHTGNGTPVRVSARCTDDRVAVAVEDGGPGIPMELRDAVFEPHVRLVDGGEGLGIGLTLVRVAVKQLGGEIRVLESAAGGTTFRVELPAATEPEVAADPRAS